MLITFKSRASPDVLMLADLANFLLGIVGSALVRAALSNAMSYPMSLAVWKRLSRKTRGRPMHTMRCTMEHKLVYASAVQDWHSARIRFWTCFVKLKSRTWTLFGACSDVLARSARNQSDMSSTDQLQSNGQ